MAMDFPASPSEGAIYTAPGGPTYVFKSGIWTISTAVLSPVPARNRIVNPSMLVSQENGDTASPAAAANAAYFAADQWLASWNLPGTAAAQRARPSISGGDHFTIWAGTASPSIAAGAYWQIYQYIEGQRVKDFLWGTAGARRAILRFSAFSNVGGTFSASIRNGVADRTYLVPFTLAANLWTTFTFVVPGDTTGSWPITNAAGMIVGFALASGTTYQGAAGWQAGNKIQIAGQTNLAAAINNSFTVTDVGLYLDDGSGIPPRWEMPSIDADLLECMRYYRLAPWSMIGYGASAGAGWWVDVPLFPSMRISPVMTIWGSTNTNTAVPTTGSYPTSMRFTMSSLAAGPFYSFFNYIANARMP